jgi:iron complex transport system substrate-binding protein
MMQSKRKYFLASILLPVCLVVWAAFTPAPPTLPGTQLRIVSMNGAISEMLCDLGLEEQIVGVDVTSTYPQSLQSKPHVGHNRNISAEGVLALSPTLVLGLKSQVTPTLQAQFQQAGVKVVLLDQVFSAAGVGNMLTQVAAAVQKSDEADALRQAFDTKMQALKMPALQKKVLFIYARGAGTMLVSGTGTSVDAMIKLAGARNAVQGFSDFKPLSAESLVVAQPDVILMFPDGLQSMGGVEGLLKVPGVAQTPAGRARKIITMDGELLTGFGLRLPEAIGELHDKIQAE